MMEGLAHLEVDFQQNMGLYANWDGFFDKESGIKFYEYTFGTECWDGSRSLTVCNTCG